MSDAWSTLDQLLETDDVRNLLLEFACEAQPGMSADEFLQSFGMQGRLGAAVGQRMARSVGIRNSTRQSFTWADPPVVTCLALLCAALARGVIIDLVESVREPEPRLRILASVPSSPAHFGGQLTIEVGPVDAGSEVNLHLVIPGQIFAWGAGKRLFKQIRSRLEDATTRVKACPSVASRSHSW